MAADFAIRTGVKVTLVGSMPTFGRKILIAGKSGLNLTMHKDDIVFQKNVTHNGSFIGRVLDEFGPNEV